MESRPAETRCARGGDIQIQELLRRKSGPPFVIASPYDDLLRSPLRRTFIVRFRVTRLAGLTRLIS